MDESEALDVVAVRAVEVADTARVLWSDDERAWASRAAAEVVGADAAPATFLARRAALVLERLGARQALLPRTVRALRWRPWIGAALAAIAFVLGIFLDQVDRAQRINILAPPVLGLLVWNLAVYAFIAVGYVLHYGDGGAPGPLRRALAAIAGGRSPSPRVARGTLQDALVALVTDWGVRSATLQSARAVRMLHVAAAALAAGVIAGLYVRGLAFEYRATWQSTFLDAARGACHCQGRIRARRAAAAHAGAGRGRGRGDTRAVVRQRRAVDPPDGGHGVGDRDPATFAARTRRAPDRTPPRGELRGPARGSVFPAPAARFPWRRGTCARHPVQPCAGHCGDRRARVDRGARVRWRRGDDRHRAGRLWRRRRPPEAGGDTALVALFNASATPEREVHGAFLEALAARGASPVALVDESAWAAHWAGEPARLDARRAAWQRLGDDAGVHMVFAELAAPDVAAAVAEFEGAMASDG